MIRSIDAADLLVAARYDLAVLYAEVLDRGVHDVVDLAGGIVRREGVLVDRPRVRQERGHRGDDVRTRDGVQVAAEDQVALQLRVADAAYLGGLHQPTGVAREVVEVRRRDVEILAVDLNADHAQRTVFAGLFGGARQAVAALFEDRVFRQHGVAVLAAVTVDSLREVPLHAELFGQIAGLVHVLARAVGEHVDFVQGHEIGVLAADHFGDRVQVGRIRGARGAGAVDVVGHHAQALALGRDDRPVAVFVVVVLVLVAGRDDEQQRRGCQYSFHSRFFVLAVRSADQNALMSAMQVWYMSACVAVTVMRK